MFAIVFAAATGCGSSKPETAPVAGRVTLEGIPVKTGTVIFYPASGHPAVGTIQSDGSYRLTTFVKDDGALLGQHVVTIEATEIVGGDTPKSFDDEYKGLRAGELRIILPLEYSDRSSSGLQALVEAKENKIDFALKKTNKNKPPQK